ncbi:MAG: hypothetical protein Kow0065_25510 [Methylomicrobium sp.]
MRILLIGFWASVMAFPVDAEVYQCISATRKITYQDKPCPTGSVTRNVELPPVDPKAQAEAERRLSIWQAEQERQRAARSQAEKERQREQERQEALDALKRSAAAQLEQAEAERRQAEALENQYRMPTYPTFYGPYSPYPNWHDRYRNDTTYRDPRPPFRKPSGRDRRSSEIERNRDKSSRR